MTTIIGDNFMKSCSGSKTSYHIADSRSWSRSAVWKRWASGSRARRRSITQSASGAVKGARNHLKGRQP